MDRQPLDPDSLLFLAIGCGIGAMMLIGTVVALLVVNGAARLARRDEGRE